MSTTENSAASNATALDELETAVNQVSHKNAPPTVHTNVSDRGCRIHSFEHRKKKDGTLYFKHTFDRIPPKKTEDDKVHYFLDRDLEDLARLILDRLKNPPTSSQSENPDEDEE